MTTIHPEAGELINKYETTHLSTVMTKLEAGEAISDALRQRDESLSAVPKWQPIETAPRDGTYILAIAGGFDDRWEHLNGRRFVIRHEGETVSGYDLGWGVYPGFGGAPDHWFSHWTPLPAPPEMKE